MSTVRSELAKQGKQEEEALDNEELTGSGKELKKLLGKIGLDDDDDEVPPEHDEPTINLYHLCEAILMFTSASSLMQ